MIVSHSLDVYSTAVFYCNKSIKNIFCQNPIFLPAKTIFAGPVFPWKKTVFPPSGKNLPTLMAGVAP